MKVNLSEKEMATIQICCEYFINEMIGKGMADEADKEVAGNAKKLLSKLEDVLISESAARFTAVYKERLIGQRKHNPKRECIHCGRKTTQYTIDENDQIVCIPCGRHYY